MRVSIYSLLLVLFLIAVVVNVVVAEKHKLLPLIGKTIVFFIALSVLVLLILSVIPSKPFFPNPQIAPSPSFEQSLAMFEEIRANESKLLILPQHRSMLMHHGRQTNHVLVCFHGFKMSPDQHVEFAKKIYANGVNVLILREPHHAILNSRYKGDEEGTWKGKSIHLEEITPESLCAFADHSINLAAGLGNRLHVFGISMGGVLSSYVACTHGHVENIVMLAPAFQLCQNSVPKWKEDLLVNLCSRGITDIQQDDFDGYDNTSFDAMAAFLRVARWVRKHVSSSPPLVKKIKVIYNQNDNRVDNEVIRDFIERVGATSHVIDKSLQVPHDALDRHGPDQKIDIVYPFLWGQFTFLNDE